MSPPRWPYVAGAAAIAVTTVACGAAGSAPPSTMGPTPPGERAVVERVVDGDTIVVDGARIRLIGIDAPESVKPDSPVECYGPEASTALKQILPRRTPVLLEYDVERTDRYGRTLAYVWLTKPLTLVNEQLVEQGYATVLSIAPNQRHESEFAAAEDRARQAQLGLWGACP